MASIFRGYWQELRKAHTQGPTAIGHNTRPQRQVQLSVWACTYTWPNSSQLENSERRARARQRARTSLQPCVPAPTPPLGIRRQYTHEEDKNIYYNYIYFFYFPLGWSLICLATKNSLHSGHSSPYGIAYSCHLRDMLRLGPPSYQGWQGNSVRLA